MRTAFELEYLVIVCRSSEDRVMNPLSLVATGVAGWMNRHQQVVIEYLPEEVAYSTLRAWALV